MHAGVLAVLLLCLPCGIHCDHAGQYDSNYNNKSQKSLSQHEDQTLQTHHDIAGIHCKCWLDTRFEPNPLHVFKNVKDERLRLSWSPFEYISVPKLWHFLYSKIFSFFGQLLTFLPTGRDELEVKTERKENLHTHSFLVQQRPDSDW